MDFCFDDFGLDDFSWDDDANSNLGNFDGSIFDHDLTISVAGNSVSYYYNGLFNPLNYLDIDMGPNYLLCATCQKRPIPGDQRAPQLKKSAGIHVSVCGTCKESSKTDNTPLAPNPENYLSASGFGLARCDKCSDDKAEVRSFLALIVDAVAADGEHEESSIPFKSVYVRTVDSRLSQSGKNGCISCCSVAPSAGITF